jgi:hypothetical protein
MSQSSGDNPVSGQVSATTTPAALAASQSCISVLVQNDPGSSNNLLVGGSGGQYINLKAGQAITVNCSNLNMVYITGNGGNATCNYLYVS